MTRPHSLHRGTTHIDDVVGVEVTIDGMLVIADRLNLMDFPVALGHTAEHPASGAAQHRLGAGRA